MIGKDFSIKFEPRETYLYVHLTGKDSFSASLDYWNQIADKAAELEIRRVLIHENLVGEVSEGELFEIIMDVLPAGVGIRLALFDENHNDMSINDFGLLIAHNRGLDLRIFHTLEDAEKWIVQDD